MCFQPLCALQAFSMVQQARESMKERNIFLHWTFKTGRICNPPGCINTSASVQSVCNSVRHTLVLR